MSAESQIANGATGAAATTGVVGSSLTFAGYLESNATIIIMGCTVLSLIIGLIFHLINSKTNRDRLNMQMADKIDGWLEEGKTHEEIERLLKLAKEFR